jgi:hypothetical protein
MLDSYKVKCVLIPIESGCAVESGENNRRSPTLNRGQQRKGDPMKFFKPFLCFHFGIKS